MPTPTPTTLGIAGDSLASQMVSTIPAVLHDLKPVLVILLVVMLGAFVLDLIFGVLRGRKGIPRAGVDEEDEDDGVED
jgi:hypothetical protein